MSYVTGKLNEQLLPRCPTRKRKSMDGCDSAVEKWCRRKIGKYNSKSKSEVILNQLSSSRKVADDSSVGNTRQQVAKENARRAKEPVANVN